MYEFRFPETPKNADTTSVFSKEDKVDEANYRPMSVFP